MDALGLTEQLASHVIRPPRATYSLEDLGQKMFEYKGIVYERADFTIPPNNPFTMKIQGSIYYDRFSKGRKLRPTVLYLHANSSSRMTVKNYLKNLIEYFDVVAFDFRGCGLSQGKYLTLGYLEKYDVQAVIQYIEKNYGGERKWMIWGRSMGAVTAILYTAKFMLNSEKIGSLVLDSPFADLQRTIHFLADKKVPLVPKFMVQSALENLEQYIKQKILSEYKKLFFIRKHKPIDQISKIKIPIFFIGSKNDEIVDSNQVQKLYEKACTKKQMEMLEGGHNEIRPQHLKIAVVEFLTASLNMKKDINLRKRIFAYGPNKSGPFGEQPIDSNISKSQPKDELVPKSKSRPKNRLFIGQSNQTPLSSQLQTQSQMAKLSLNNNQISRQQKIASKKQTQQTHVQILDKVLPQSSARRNNRIFTHVVNANRDKDKYKESEGRSDIL